MTDKISDPFVLSPAERASPLWHRLLEHLETELKNKRGKNDGIDNTEQQTAALRGHITCLRGLIALGDDPPLVE
jgi:hypothetical protein